MINLIRQNFIVLILNGVSYVKWVQVCLFGERTPTVLDLPSSYTTNKKSIHNVLFPYIEDIRFEYPDESRTELTEDDKTILFQTISILQKVNHTEKDIYQMLYDSFKKYKEEETYSLFSLNYGTIDISFPTKIYIEQNNDLIMITQTQKPFNTSLLSDSKLITCLEDC